MATIKDVAKAAGVSLSTASYALNDSPKISAETKERVRKVAQDLRYFPDGTAKNLKKSKTETVGVFLGDLTGPLYGEIIDGIQEVLASTTFDLILCSNHGGKVRTAQKFLHERRVDGAIILSPYIDDGFIRDMVDDRLPIVFLDRELKGKSLYSILIDNRKGAQLATAHLLSLGRGEVHYLGGSSLAYDETKRFEGYLDGLTEKGIQYKKEWRLEGNFTEDSGYRVIKGLIAKGEVPRSLFAANDEMAIGAMRALAEASIPVPGRVAIVGFDDIKLASYIHPRLSTISRPKFEMGVLAAHVLLKAIAGENVKSSVTLSVDLVVRESCGGVVPPLH